MILGAKREHSGRTLLLIFLGILAGCTPPSEERTVDLTVPVTVQPVILGTIEAVVTATGTLRPRREAELLTEVRGDLFFIASESGEKPGKGSLVQAGQMMFELKNQEWVVSARLKSRQLAMENARRTLKEQETLLERGLVTEVDVETARKTLVDAESDHEDALIQIDKTRRRAPISGYLTELTDATEGTLVEQGTLIGKIVDYSQVLVDLNIPNAQIRDVGPGQEVRVINYAFPDRVFPGQITAVDPALDPTTRTFQVEATMENPDLLLRPGMFVKAEIVTESHKDAVLVPRALILTRRNRKVVFVEENARAQMRELETGLEDQEHVEIVRGLEEGERLITSNYETLRSRARVQVTGEGVPGGAMR